MKKILLICILLYGIGNTTFAYDIDFLVKKSTSGDETYSQNISDISTSRFVTFELTSILSSSGSKEFQVSFPAGFQYQNHRFEGNCDINLKYNSNSNFGYIFSTGGVMCVSKVSFEYEVPSSPGNYMINILEGGSIKKSVSIGVIAYNTIIKAYSLDQDGDGFLDGYEIYFAKKITDTQAINGLKVGNENVTSYNGNSFSGIISFQDNIFNTGDLPQITSSGTTFGNVGILGNTSIIEEDGANPVLLNINGGNAIIGSDSLNLNFSEFLNISQNLNNKIIIKDKNNALISFSPNWTNTGKTLQITPNQTLLSNQNPYTLEINNIEDWSKNKLSLSQTFQVQTNSCSITTLPNGNISAFPSCQITCNSGYTLSGNACVLQNSGGGGGGGGGGGTSTCITSQLECSLYNGSYIWQRKSGISCNGGDLGKACTRDDDKQQEEKDKDSSQNDDKDENTSGNTGGNGENIPQKTLEEIRDFLLKNTHPSLKKYIDQFYTKLNFPYKEYFIQSSLTYKQNSTSLLSSYANIFTHLNTYISSRDASELQKAKQDAGKFKNFYALSQGKERRYISITSQGKDILYKTNYKQIQKALDQIENILLKKFSKLKDSKTITKSQYDQAIRDYNDFVFYLSVYKFDKTSLSKELAKNSIKNFLQIYSKKVLKAPKTPIIQPPAIKQTLIKEVFSLSRDVKFGDYNDDVENLQKILKHFGYFPFEPTGYFGAGTQEYLEKFIQVKFQVSFQGTLNKELREKIGNLEY